MKDISNKGALIPVKGGVRKTILEFAKSLLREGVFDGILISMRVPAKDSYAWVLIKDPSFIDKATPLAPIIAVQGAKALKSFTRKGKGSMKIAAVMRPCEIRATVELVKLNQIHLENITLISIDCPGALPTSYYIKNPEDGEKDFNDLFSGKDRTISTRAVCQICDHFSILPSCDLHFGLTGEEGEGVFLIPNSEKGERILKEMKIKSSETLTDWKNSVKELIEERKKQRAERFQEVKSMVAGFDSMLDTFAKCIGCHNCQSACPICYCRLCYFDSAVSRQDSDFILQKARRRGGISFPVDRILFHVGRMSHMSLSCVSCGVCSDACPVSIPVADVFSYVADQTQGTFEYRSGEDIEEAIPVAQYQLEEVRGVEELIKQAEE